MTYAPTLEEKAMWAWLNLVMDEDVTEIRFANQAAPRPDTPFVTLQVISDVATQTAEVTTTSTTLDDGYVTTIHEYRVASVSINVFGEDHRSLMRRIERSIADPFVVDFNTDQGIEVQATIGSANDLSALHATEYEGRTQLDFRIGYSTTDDSPFPMRDIKDIDISAQT